LLSLSELQKKLFQLGIYASTSTSLPPAIKDNLVIGNNLNEYENLTIQNLVDKLSALNTQSVNAPNGLLKLDNDSKIAKELIAINSIEQNMILNDAVSIDKILKDDNLKNQLSTLLQLDSKVDKVEGKALSDNNLTDELLQQINFLIAGGNPVEQTVLYDQTFPAVASKTFNISEDFLSLASHYSMICFMIKTSIHYTNISIATSVIPIGSIVEIGKFDTRFVLLHTPPSTSSTQWIAQGGNVSIEAVKVIAF